MLILILLSVFAHASLREPGAEPGPRPLCRRAEMNSCVENHNAARNAELNAIAAIDGKIQILQRDRGAILHESTAIENEVRKANTTAEMSEREIHETALLSSSEPIFPGGPAAEEIFLLRGEPNSWDERYASERRARLNTLVKSSREKSSQLQALRQNLAMEIEALGVLDASLLQERFQRGQQVNVHADMCNSGCRMQFCRDE